METSKDYKDLILEQLDLLDNINCRAMMWEYLLYYNKILFGGIYDNRLLVKIVDSNKKYNMQEQIPYESAKAMYLVDNIDNREKLKEYVNRLGFHIVEYFNEKHPDPNMQLDCYKEDDGMFRFEKIMKK